MEQKEVKIIGLKVNHQMGILQSCQLKFDPKNNLIAVKGEVGSGKTTLQKGIQLGTLGSETLKDDKNLYGKIDEEVQLMDGIHKVFVGCKSNKAGGLDYTIYTKNEEGKKVKEPVIDGVKLTPGNYLKNMQTALTWRIDELMSENPTVQKKLLLELYKTELAKAGVIFNKKDEGYADSILGRIEIAENDRAQREFERKQVGGFANQLTPLGIDVSEESTWPTRVDTTDMEAQKNKLQYQIDNVGEAKEQDLKVIKNKADAVIVELKELNNIAKEANKKKEDDFQKLKEQHSQNIHTKNGILTDIQTLVDNNCFIKDSGTQIAKLVEENFRNPGIESEPALPELQFNEEGKIVSKPSEFGSGNKIHKKLLELYAYGKEYKELVDSPGEDTSKYEDQLEVVTNQIAIAKEQNRKCDMLDSFIAWREANDKVMELREEYASMLAGINTGVDGLNINVDKEEGGKMDIYLTYNGEYDKKYFNNPKLEQRKLSSYSGTQKPLICLLLQNYLLSKKPKALRYLWIDNVPIDKKTKELLNRMGKELNLTIIVNITGDFTKEGLEPGEILLEGGEVFFN